MSGKKRRRGLGPFICLSPNCGKVFSRSDHLARHKVNHSSNKFKCGWPGCSKSFARPDVMKKHESRHAKNGNQLSGMKSSGKSTSCDADVNDNKRDESNPKDRNATSSSPLSSPLSKLQTSHELLTVQDDTTFLVEKQSIGLANQNDLLNTGSADVQLDYENVEVSLRNSNGGSVPIGTSKEKGTVDLRIPEPAAQQPFEVSYYGGIESPSAQLNLLSPFHWLLAFQAYRKGEIGLPTFEMLKKVFTLAPQFPDADCQSDVNNDLLSQMKRYIPELAHHPDFVDIKVKWFLDAFWHLYHSQYPILHRPSFSVFDCQHLLLLSMIMMGALYSKRTNAPEHLDIKDSDGLADAIAELLRSLIFASEEARPPCRSWVLQSLIILETYEITGSSRSLHERAVSSRERKYSS